VYFQLIPVNGSLWVEGDNPAVGGFAGHVTAIGVRDYDPVASPRTDRPSQDGTHVEGLWGWGTTHFLVCDPDRPAPVWVSKEDVRRHSFETAHTASRP
jgi:hypothetical protein